MATPPTNNSDNTDPEAADSAAFMPVEPESTSDDIPAGSMPSSADSPLSANSGLGGAIASELGGRAFDKGVEARLKSKVDPESGGLDNEGRRAKRDEKIQDRAGSISNNDSLQSRLQRGAADRKSGAKLKEGYKIEREGRKLAGSGSKGLIEGAGKAVVQESAKDAAKFAGREAADLAVPGLGVVSAVPLDKVRKTAQDVARELKDFNVIRAGRKAVTGVGTIAAVTLFRASYDWYVIGFSMGLSLIVTWALGTVLLFMPSAELNSMEKLGIAAVNLFLFFVILFALILFLALFCTGVSVAGSGFSGVGILVNAASYFSGLSDVCKGLSIK